MASIENLEIVVDVDITRALAALEDLQSELRDLAEHIEAVDAIGTEGVNVRTDVDDIDDDLAAMAAKVEAAERGMGMNVPVDLRDEGVPALPAGTGVGPTVYRGPATRREGPGILTRSFRRLANTARNLHSRLSGIDIRMSDLHNTLARLVPLLLVFIGTIPAAVTAMVTLAAAAISAAAGLAALAGLGALGVGLEGGQFEMDNLTQVWEDVRDSFIEAFAPLAERLQPLFMDAIDGLERFFQAVANEGDALMELTDEARAFGQFIMDFVPGALRNMAALVESIAPLFGEIAGFFEESNILRGLVEVTMEAMPALRQLLGTIIDALPHIARMSVGFAMVSSTVADTVGIIYSVIRAFGFTDAQLGLIIASLLTMTTLITLLNTRLVGLAVRGIVAATIAMYEFWLSVLQSNTALTTMIYQTVVGAISSIYSFIVALLTGSSSMLGFAASTFTATGALAAFLTLATLGGAIALVAMATSAAAGFLSMADGIDQATSSLKEFDRVSGRAGSGSFNPYAPDSGVTDPNATEGGGRGGTTINIESSGDPEEDRSNARYAGWRQGRTTGGYA